MGFRLTFRSEGKFELSGFRWLLLLIKQEISTPRKKVYPKRRNRYLTSTRNRYPAQNHHYLQAQKTVRLLCMISGQIIISQIPHTCRTSISGVCYCTIFGRPEHCILCYLFSLGKHELVFVVNDQSLFTQFCAL